MMLKWLLLGTIIIFGAIYEANRRSDELDYLHHIPVGTLNISFKNAEQYEYEGLNLKIDENLWIYFRGKQVLRGKGENFLTLLKSEGVVKSDGDSFYDVNDEPKKICRQQMITEIKMQKESVRMKGFFEDCADSGYRMVIKVQRNTTLFMKVTLNSRTYNRMKISFHHEETTHYYGLGEQFSHLCLGNNRPYSLLVREKGVGRTEQPETTLLNYFYGAGGSYYNSYSPAPIWITSLKFGYLIDSYAYAAWMNNQILLWDTDVSLYVFSSQNMKDIVRLISGINGYTEPVSDWVNEGAIVGVQGNTTNVMNKYTAVKEAGAIVRGLWIQDWVSKRMSLGLSRLWWNWELDIDHYPRWDQMKHTLNQQQVQLLIYINPMLVNVSTKPYFSRHYFQEALYQHHFITHNNSQLFTTSAFSDYQAAMIDFDKDGAVEFYQGVVKEAVESTGAKGMMVDFAEAYPIENMHGSVEEAIKFHNEYPVKYHRRVREALKSMEKDKKIYSFGRAGYLRAPMYSHSLWAGDQTMNFKKHSGLPSCLIAMLSSGLVGYSNTHCDIGGYTSFSIFSNRTEILLQRWLQLSAFSPVFRSHEGNSPDHTLQIYSHPQLLNDFAFYSHVFHALASYRKHHAAHSYQERIPLLRSMFLEHDDNQEVYGIEDQYYLGDDLLVCPLLQQHSERKLYLPHGQWVNIWNRHTIEGCNCYLSYKAFLPPVFIKQHSQFLEQVLQKVQKALQQFNRMENAEEQKPQQ